MKTISIVLSSLAALVFQSSSTLALAVPDTNNPLGLTDTAVAGVKVTRSGTLFVKKDDKTNTYCQHGSYELPAADYVKSTEDMKSWLDSNTWWGDKTKDFWSNEVCAFIRNKGNTQNFPGAAFQNDLDNISGVCGVRIAGFVAHDSWNVNYGVFNCQNEYPGI
ncbi:hypothetical protein BDV96DRAFT_572188 [Lophiotrema nucula]|uniref:Ecp2 effector protein domain-containing protein n=1 Tax=Lophiotrema nucula TaxID=690887 RepID=A0A6A5ZAC5_9PLEO|nr:hypothetical protein BDV96DRAFT_572188 [Lophiotrema nucula]